MPLDKIAQRYAEGLFVGKMEELARKRATRERERRAALAQRGILPHTAGLYHSDAARAGVEHIGEIADARVDTLLAAYERARLPVDDQAVADICRAAAELCQAQARNLSANIREQVGRAGMPQGVAEQTGESIANGISAVEARVYRRVSAKRDEEILAARAAPQPESAEPDRTGTSDHRLTQLWHWSAKWQWYAGLFAGAFFMISIREYLLSLLLLFLSAVSLLSKLMHWKGTTTFKFLGGAGIACAFVSFLFIIVAEKGKNPWSHLEQPLLGYLGFISPAPPPAPALPRPPTLGTSQNGSSDGRIGPLKPEPGPSLSKQVAKEHTHVEFVAPDIRWDNPSFLFRAGNPICLDVNYHNAGDYAVRNASPLGARIYLRLASTASGEDQMLVDFKRNDHFPPTESILVAHEKYMYHTFCSAELSEQQVRQLNDGSLYLCVVDAVRWEDDSGRYETDLCQCMEPPHFRPREVLAWHNCTMHNGEVKVQ